MAETVVTPKDGGTEQTNAQAAVSLWARRIKKASETKEARAKEIRQWRKYVTGEQHSDGAPGLVRTNLVHAHIAASVPNVYAKNPEVAVSPSDGVPPAQLEQVKKFGKTCEAILKRRFIKDTKLKKRIHAALRSVFTTGDGWLKMAFIEEPPALNPSMKARLDDITDNIKSIEALGDSIESNPQMPPEQRKQKLYELEQQQRAIQEQLEVPAQRSLAIDKIRSEDVVILDDTVQEFEEYEVAEALAHCVWYTKDRYEAEFGAMKLDDPTADLPTMFSATKNEKGEVVYAACDRTQSQPLNNTKAETEQYIRVWEIWHRGPKTIYTWAEGMKGWCREPSPPKYYGERFYGLFRLGFNHVDGMVEATSDVALLKELQDEYNRTRTNFSEHRAESLPVRLARKAGNLTDEDIKAIQKRKLGDILLVEGKPGEPLQNDLFEFENVPIDPMVYDVTQIRADMEMVVGRQDAEVGNVLKPKTATEAQIMASGSSARSEFRNDTMEDVLTEMAEYALQVFLQAYTPQDIEKIVGPEQAQAWPTLNREGAFDFVQVEIIAGSMRKPNRAEELERWTQLFPVIQQGILQVGQLRMQGMMTEADALVRLIKETVSRFEERIDIDSFLGNGEDGQMNAMMQLQVQNQQLQQALAQAQEQLAAMEGQAKDAVSQGEKMQKEGQAMQEQAAGEVERLSKENETLKQAAQKRETELQVQLRKQSDQLASDRQAFQTEQMKAGYENQLADLQRQLEQATAQDKAEPQGEGEPMEEKHSEVAELMSVAIQAMSAAVEEMRDMKASSGDMQVEYSPEGRVVGLKRRREVA